MRVPANVTELKQIIMPMSHRERLCFPASDKLRKAFSMVDSIEVYVTTLFDSKYCDKNVNIKAVSVDGSMVTINNNIYNASKCASDRPLLNKSKYMRLMCDAYFQEIFNIIGGEVVPERGMIEIAGNGSPVIR